MRVSMETVIKSWRSSSIVMEMDSAENLDNSGHDETALFYRIGAMTRGIIELLISTRHSATLLPPGGNKSTIMLNVSRTADD